MTSKETIETMTMCANMILTDAIEDFALENNIPLSEARHRILSSRACESLYNFKTKLWAEGPDYFRAFYEAVETVETVERNSKGKGISKDNTQKRGSQQVMNDKS